MVIIKAGLQVFPFSLFFYNQETFLWQLVLVIESIIINYTYAVNAVRTSMPEATDEEVSFLIRLVPEG